MSLSDEQYAGYFNMKLVYQCAHCGIGIFETKHGFCSISGTKHSWQVVQKERPLFDES